MATHDDDVEEDTAHTAAAADVEAEDIIASSASKSAEAWVIDFSGPKIRRKATRKEQGAMRQSRQRRPLTQPDPTITSTRLATDKDKEAAAAPGCAATTDSEGNATIDAARALPRVHIDDIVAMTASDTVAADAVDDTANRLIPRGLTPTRADLSARCVLSLPRLLCVNKQYPRSCGVSALTSVYNYLYSWIGESECGQNRPPVTQEEVMSELGFAPPFGDIPWGTFTGNATLMRWFHALNRRYRVQGRAYILYKAHGRDRTTWRYRGPDDVLAAVKAALRDPHCALIYHCHNHYMVPVGYQDIPRAQVDFLRPHVDEQDCETTVFIADVSRGKHDAMYARRWSQIVQDIEMASPNYVNIRQPHMGVQVRSASAAADDTSTASPAMPSEEAMTEPSSSVGKKAEAESKDECKKSESVAAMSGEEGLDAEQPVMNETGQAKAQSLTPESNTGADATPRRARFRTPNNLHCLICFRNDETEPNMERFENASSSSSSSESSSDSDTDKNTATPDTAA